eukprot:gene36049-42794_t
MGGAAFVPGNSTPDAEFNFWFDPHAAEIMVSAGVPMVMFGLDVTHKARMTPERMAALKATGSKVTDVVVGMMAHYGAVDPCLHDPCVIAYLIDPTLFSGVDARISVECASPMTIGRSVAAISERHRKGGQKNAHVITEVDNERLFDLLDQRLKFFDQPQS